MHVGRVAVVTGAASGIGRATAELLVTQGASVVAVDRDRQQLEWAEHNPSIATVIGDVRSIDVNEAAVHAALHTFGRLDAMVLNAGVSAGGDLLDQPLERFDEAFEINVRAVVVGIRACVPAMRTAGSGRICVTASTSGLAGDPSMWAYNATKAAVINLCRAAAIDLAVEGITVNAVCPGPTETAMTAGILALPQVHNELRRAIPMQRWAQAFEIAAAIGFLVSPAASFITGVALPVDGGITANTGQFRPRQGLGAEA